MKNFCFHITNLNIDFNIDKLSKFIDISKKNNIDNLDQTFTISTKFGIVPQNIIFNKKVSGKDLAKYKIIENNMFAYNKSKSNDYPLGCVRRMKFDIGLLSNFYTIFSIKNIDLNYAECFFESIFWKKELFKNISKAVRNQLSCSDDVFLNLNILYPNTSNQEIIGKIFVTLKELIFLKSQKIESLEKVKKYFLQTMFCE